MQRRGYSLFRAVDLVLLSILKKLSEPEKEELERMKQETGLQQHAGELFDPAAVQELLRQESPFDTEEAYRRFLGKVSRKLPRQSSRGVFHWLRYAALWLLPLMAGGLIWYLMPGHHREQFSVEEIQPVGNNAFLTFANGSRVQLTTGRKDLSEEDGTLVVQDSGCLVYTETRKMGDEILFNHLTVPRGGEYLLELADGTKIWLNSESELKYPVQFIGNSREVFLKGEGYFAVSRDVTKPFVVHTSLGRVEVLGTEFNVRDYAVENRVVTTLVNGKVKYKDPVHVSRELELFPGFQITDRGGQEVLMAKKVNLSESVGWKDGLYVFNQQTLEEMMQTLERNYNVTVFFTNEAIKHLRFSGDLKKYDRVEHFLRFIETGGDVTFQVRGRTITVLPK